MITLEDISHKFNNLTTLNNISFSINNHEIIAILGPSGCGKSTLLRVIANLEQNYSGKLINNNCKISFAFQDNRLLPWKNVWDNIKIVDDNENKNQISSLIKEVGLEGFESFKPAQLSGGMKKRLGIARTFYYKSDLVLMDEPFSGLDYYMRQDMLNMILKLQKKSNQSILFVTHEIDDALKIADRIIVLSSRPASIIKEIDLPYISIRNQNLELMNQIKEDIMSNIMA